MSEGGSDAYYDDGREIQSDFENSEDETRRFRIGAFRKKAINASNKFTRSLRKRGKKKVDYRFPSVSIEDVHDSKEENVVYELHQQLLDRNLLPSIHDDYHTLLRFLKARDFNIGKTIQMWEEMLNWRKEYGPCSPIGRSSSSIPRVSPLDEEARESNSTPYASCDDQFSPGEQVDVNEHGLLRRQEPAEFNLTNVSTNAGRHSEGTLVIHWFETIQEKVLSRCIQCLERKLISFILKLSGLVRSVFFEYWRKQANVSNTSPLEERQESSSSVYGEAVHKVEEALPCMERLHRLEMLFDEIKRKPAQIPAENDQMIQQSMERIKSVEMDLNMTKRVLHVAVVKQLEIAKLLENLQQSRFHRRRLLC